MYGEWGSALASPHRPAPPRPAPPRTAPHQHSRASPSPPSLPPTYGKSDGPDVATAVRTALEAGYCHIDGAAVCAWPRAPRAGAGRRARWR